MPTIIDLSPIEFNFQRFMINLDKCNGTCNAVGICVLSKAKCINVKVFTMITRINEARIFSKHISYNCKCKFNSSTCNSNKKWNHVRMTSIKKYIADISVMCRMKVQTLEIMYEQI